MNHPKIGAHVSAAGGLYNVIENAKNIGAECIQIFGASPRQWYAKMPAKETVERFKSEIEKSKIGPVYLHASYLVNLATPMRGLLKKSIKSLTDHLAICSQIGAEGLIFHVGSGKDTIKKAALDQEILAMKKVLKGVPGSAQLIMENTAGGGKKIGTVEDIAYLHKKVSSPRVKVCIDTAHAFESGMIEEYNPAEVKKLFDTWDEALGMENITVLHVNDSKTKSGSCHDRHENIGKGHIGLNGFKALAKEKRLKDKAWILEVPGFKGNGPDKKNVDILKSLFNQRI